jgi:hypothetical protein
VNGLVAARSPAGALLDPRGVVGTSNENYSSLHLLEMALETEVRISNGEQFDINRAVGGVAGRASFADGLVFEHMGTSLGGMTAEAALVGIEQ